jgi:hypothetical protein
LIVERAAVVETAGDDVRLAANSRLRQCCIELAPGDVRLASGDGGAGLPRTRPASAEGTPNLYRYVRNDPVNLVDPTVTTIQDDIDLLTEVWDDITDVFETDIRIDPRSGERALAGKQAQNLLAKTELDEQIGDLRAKQAAARYKIGSGGFLSTIGFCLQAVDFVDLYRRARENNRSVFEQSDVDEQEKYDRSVRTFVNCLGAVCLVKELI